MDNTQQLRERLVKLLLQGSAFKPLPETLKSIPFEVTGQQLDGFAHTVWELTEHIRIAMHDLVEYSKDSYFESPPWPDGFWPEESAPSSEKEWKYSIQQINDLREEMIQMVKDPSNDLFEPFKANADHNLFRQATIAAEHAAYHGGQIAMLSKAIERQQ